MVLRFDLTFVRGAPEYNTGPPRSSLEITLHQCVRFDAREPPYTVGLAFLTPFFFCSSSPRPSDVLIASSLRGFSKSNGVKPSRGAESAIRLLPPHCRTPGVLYIRNGSCAYVATTHFLSLKVYPKLQKLDDRYVQSPVVVHCHHAGSGLDLRNH